MPNFECSDRQHNGVCLVVAEALRQANATVGDLKKIIILKSMPVCQAATPFCVGIKLTNLWDWGKMRANQRRPPGRRWNYPKPFVKTFISNGPVEASAADCVQAASNILDQGSGLLKSLSDEAYCRRLAAASGASIGGHYRHCLDHFVCLLEGMNSGVLDYDKRRRDGQMEHRRAAALAATEEIREALAILDGSILERLIRVQCKIHYGADRSQQVKSTVARELMYVVAHAVHHFALIAVMAKVMNFPLPGNFGVAPSTLQHRSQASGGVLA